MKPCTICRLLKDLSDFHNDSKGSDGKSAQCKDCRLLKKRSKYHTDSEARAKERMQQRAYYQKHRDHLKQKARQYQLLHAIERAAYHEDYRKRPGNQEKANQRSRKYRSNPDNLKVLSHRAMQYVYRKYQAVGNSTKAQLQARWDYYSGNCWICGQVAKEFDHVKPLTKGGSNWPANLRPVCRSCNARKGNTWPYRLLT